MRVVPDLGEPWRISSLVTPVGRLTVVHAQAAVVAASFASARSRLWFGRTVVPSAPPAWLRALVATALVESLGEFPWSLVDPGVSTLEVGALAEATRIPFGETRAYGEVARAMGRPGRARMVGRAMSLCPASLLIPTHRVIRADGRPAPSERGGIADRLRAYEQARLLKT